MLRKRTRSIQKEQRMSDHQGRDRGSDGYLQSGIVGQRQKAGSLFNVPGLFIGLAPKGASDCDSARSPTSPLDFKLLSNLGGSFRASRCSHEGKRWDSDKVGLGIVDSLGHVDGAGNLCRKVIGLTNTKSIVFGLQITKTLNSATHFGACAIPESLPMKCDIFPRTHAKSPKRCTSSSNVLFEIGEDPSEPYAFAELRSLSLDSKSLGSNMYGLVDHRSSSASSRSSGMGNASSGQEDSLSRLIGGSPKLEDISQKKLGSASVVVGSAGNGFVGCLSPSEIELSEDYTCVISHGPNPKTTHIYCDWVLECHSGEADSLNKKGSVETVSTKLGNCSKFSGSYPDDNVDDFLSFCCFCKKKLEDGKDIFMYRGERAFCSSDCRLEEILIEEGKEKSISEASKESPPPTLCDNNFENVMFVAA